MVLQFWEYVCSFCCVVCDIMAFVESSPWSINAGCVDVGTSSYYKVVLDKYIHSTLVNP